jgi:hypothetical protein
MKSRLVSAVFCMLVLSPFTLFAASKNSQSVTFSKPVSVGGTSVPAGNYKIEWEGAGNVTASILRGKKVVATVPATVTETKSNFDGALHYKDSVLQEILWKNVTIDFTQSAAPAASSSGNY